MSDQLPQRIIGTTPEIDLYEQQLTSTQTNVTLPSDPNYSLHARPTSINLGASESATYPDIYHFLSNVPLQSPRTDQATTSIITQRQMEVGESSGRKRKRKELDHTQAKSEGKDGELKEKGDDLQSAKSRSQMHTMSERRRRERIREKMKALKELVPDCNKIGKADILDDAIAFITTMKRQIQMMSMGVNPIHHMAPGMNFQMQTYGMPWSPALSMIPPLLGSFHPPPAAAVSCPPLYGPGMVAQPQVHMQFNPLQPLPAARSASVVHPTFVPAIPSSSNHPRQREPRSRTTPRIPTSLPHKPVQLMIADDKMKNEIEDHHSQDASSVDRISELVA